MIVAILMGALEVSVPALGALGIRAAWSHAARKSLRRAAQSDVEQFKTENDFRKPLEGKEREATEELHAFLAEASAMRADVMKKMKEMEVPGGDVSLMPQVKADLQSLENNFLSIMKRVSMYKVGFLARDEIDYRMAIANGWKMHAHHLGPVDKYIVAALDKVGALHGVQHVAQTVTDGVSTVIKHHDHFIAHNLISLPLHPNLISGMKLVMEEAEWLMNDEVSLTDSLCHGVMPWVLRKALRSAGLAIDLSAGWMTGGLFTGGSIVLGNILSQKMLEAELDKQIRKLNKHIDVIRERQFQGLKTINGARDDFQKSYVEEIEKCPDAGKAPELVPFISATEQAYATGLINANLNTSVRKRKKIKALPKAKWLHKLLGIDPAVEVGEMYDTAERELHLEHMKAKHEFSMAINTHAVDAVEFMLTEGVIDHPEIHQVMKNVSVITARLPIAHAGRVDVWQQGCEALWADGTKRIADIIHEEHAEMAEVAAQQEPLMKPIRRKIYNLQRRLRHKEPIAV